VSLVRLHGVSKAYDGNLLLREVHFRLSEGDRVGLIGRNGTGKTTVLRLILGLEEPTEGQVDVDDGLSMGYFSQFSQLDAESSVVDILDEVFADIHALEDEIAQAGDAIATAQDSAQMDALLHRQAKLFEEMQRREGWSYPVKIDTVLTRLGFSSAHRERPVGQLSGGWRNRAALAQMLLQKPDVLLLDEPTNYLDIDGLRWLEEWLLDWRGAMMLVSHDRHFLDRVANRIVEIESYHFQEYNGGFTFYVREKPLRLKSLQRQFEHEEELLAFEAEAIADRREAAQDPSRALKRRLANIKKRTTPRPVDRIVTDVYRELYVAAKLCRAERLRKSYGAQVLFDDLSFEVQREDRIVVIGPNGCGKTTLLRVLTGLEEADAGRAVWSKGVDYVYYNEVLDALDLGDTVTHAVNVTGLAYYAPRKRVNRFLSLLQFTEMDLTQRIGTLSGGQRARVALAKCLLYGASVIVLDEPTNHLDMPSAQVMERAILHFPGAVIVASHDRFFIDKIATRLLVFRGEGVVEEVAGNWTIWEAARRRSP
jgi:ATPase subunit of ABC transporter with duplicated ATPase domains